MSSTDPGVILAQEPDMGRQIIAKFLKGVGGRAVVDTDDLERPIPRLIEDRRDAVGPHQLRRVLLQLS